MNQFTLPVVVGDKLVFEMVKIKTEKERLEVVKRTINFMFNFMSSSVVKKIFQLFFKFLVAENITNSNKLEQLQWKTRSFMIERLNAEIQELEE